MNPSTSGTAQAALARTGAVKYTMRCMLWVSQVRAHAVRTKVEGVIKACQKKRALKKEL